MIQWPSEIASDDNFEGHWLISWMCQSILLCFAQSKFAQSIGQT